MTNAQVWEVVLGSGGVIGVIGVLLRISFQLGSLVTEFRAYVKLNDLVVDKIDKRVGVLEAYRRSQRGR